MPCHYITLHYICITYHTTTYNYIPRPTTTYITCHYSPLQGCVAMMFDEGKYPDNSFFNLLDMFFWSWSRAWTCTEAVRCCTGRWHFGNNLKTIYTHCIIKHCCIHWGVLLGVVTTYFGVRLDDVKLWPAAAISQQYQQLHFFCGTKRQFKMLIVVSFTFHMACSPLPDLRSRLQMARLEWSTVEFNSGDGMIHMNSKYRGAKRNHVIWKILYMFWI